MDWSPDTKLININIALQFLNIQQFVAQEGMVWNKT